MRRALISVPDYICLQTTERIRSGNAGRKPKPLDTVELEVAHIGKQEMYSWPGHNMFADTQLQRELRSGLVATGGYTSQVIDVLFGPTTRFRWVGRETINGRATLRWDFTVPQTDSMWSVGDGRQSAKVGAQGSLWIDPVTLDIVRLQAAAVQFPARFPLKAVTRTIDYARMRIGTRDVLMPSAEEDVVETARGVHNINRSRFGHCREYSAVSTLSFDTPAAGLAPEGPKTPLARLPPDLRIPLALDGHLRSKDARLGAAVTAHVASDVRHAGTVLLAKGTPVRGVLRQFAKISDGLSFTFTLEIQFFELTLPEGTVPFRAELKTIEAPNKGLWWLIPGESGMMRPVQSLTLGLVDDGSPNSMIKLDPEPGVAVLIFRRQDSFDLIPGTRMVWVTLADAGKQ